MDLTSSLYIGAFLLATLFISNAIAACLERAQSARVARKSADLARGALADNSTKAAPIPVTLVTGFLGAGKTVLLNALLESGERRICVIENEVGAVSVDHALLVTPRPAGAAVATDVLVLKNGCMCCSATGPGGELERTLDRLLSLRDGDAAGSDGGGGGAAADAAASGAAASYPRFEHLVVELSGLADPAPIVATFTRPDVAQRFALDGVVAVVDAKHIGAHLSGTSWLSRSSDAARQISFADVVLINKVDVASASEIAAARDAVADVNPTALVHETMHCALPNIGAQLLALSAYRLQGMLNLSTVAGVGRAAAAALAAGSPAAPPPHEHGSVRRVLTLIPAGPLTLGGLTTFLERVTAAHGAQLYRIKGILLVEPPPCDGGASVSASAAALPFVVQGVHEDVQGAFLSDCMPAFASAASSTAAAPSFTPALVLIGPAVEKNEVSLRALFRDIPLYAPRAAAPKCEPSEAVPAVAPPARRRGQRKGSPTHGT